MPAAWDKLSVCSPLEPSGDKRLSQGAVSTPSELLATARRVVPALTVATDKSVRLSSSSTNEFDR